MVFESSADKKENLDRIMKNIINRLLVSLIVGVILLKGILYSIRDVPISFGEISVVILFLIIVVIVYTLISIIKFLIKNNDSKHPSNPNKI